MIPRTMRAILQALSFDNIEIESSRRLADLKRLDPMRIFLKKLDAEIYNEDYKIPIRLYFPSEETMKAGLYEGHTHPIILFFHGGGWVTESVENYDRVCGQMAQSTDHIVVSVEYRLAPEHRFPTGLMDCYSAAKALFTNQFFLHVDPNRITLVGDSAGGNLAAAVSTMARDRGEFLPRQQILIYPALGNCYTKESPYPSVQENGTGYLLTAGKMEDYLTLYQRTPEDRKNVYFSPILEPDLAGMPDTLILTSEFDPLRDEGEAYAHRLKEAGNYVEQYRIQDALHGFFALGIKFLHVEQSFEYMNRFLERDEISD